MRPREPAEPRELPARAGADAVPRGKGRDALAGARWTVLRHPDAAELATALMREDAEVPGRAGTLRAVRAEPRLLAPGRPVRVEHAGEPFAAARRLREVAGGRARAEGSARRDTAAPLDERTDEAELARRRAVANAAVGSARPARSLRCAAKPGLAVDSRSTGRTHRPIAGGRALRPTARLDAAGAL